MPRPRPAGASWWSGAVPALLEALKPEPPIVRYQREPPGARLHLDLEKLGRIDGVGHRITGDRRGRKRGSGWDFLHVGGDDASRLASTGILPDGCRESAVAVLERVMTDSPPPRGRSGTAGAGGAHRSSPFRRASHDAGLQHQRTRPDRPQIIDSRAVDPVPQGTARHASLRGHAERFVQTSRRGRAHRRQAPQAAPPPPTASPCSAGRKDTPRPPDRRRPPWF